MRYPRKLGRRGRRLKTPLNHPDIMPTLLHLAGRDVPGAVQGTDYSGLLTGRADRGNKAALLSLPVPITEARRWGFAEYRGLRTERHTYVRSIKGPWLLYDNASDPYQKQNLIGGLSTGHYSRHWTAPSISGSKMSATSFCPRRSMSGGPDWATTKK